MSLSPSDLVTLASTPFLPLLLIWSYRLIYAVLGGTLWAYRLPLQAIEKDAPEIIVFSPQELSRQDMECKKIRGIRWVELLGLVSAERQILGQLVRLGSSLIAVTRDQVFPIHARIRFYQALKMGMRDRTSGDQKSINANLDYVKSWWFIAQVALSLLLGILFFVQPLRAVPATCPDPDSCPQQVVYISATTKLTGSLFSFVLLTPLVLFVRTRLQHRMVKHALQLLRRA